MIKKLGNILILGAYGRLGEDLSRFLNKYHNVIRQGRHKDAQVYLPSLDVESLKQVLIEFNITSIINLIAMTNVNDCENMAGDAFFANAIIPKYIRSAVKQNNNEIFVLHISTDQIYSGHDIHEEHQVNPCNVYGASKLAGEQLINASSNTCILRTNYFGFSKVGNRSSFLDWLVTSIKAHQEISIYQDVYFTPVGSKTLCSVISMLIDNRTSGIYNFGSSKSISKADFALIVANIMEISDPRFIITDYPKASSIKRPNNMSMKSEKILNTLNMCPVAIEREVKRELETLTI
jgi:dTDP-4-dehydrorhamnose reductase